LNELRDQPLVLREVAVFRNEILVPCLSNLKVKMLQKERETHRPSALQQLPKFPTVKKEKETLLVEGTTTATTTTTRTNGIV
jgi:hypothetical protein